MSMMKKAEYWAAEHADALRHDIFHEAVEDALDQYPDDFPTTLVMVGWSQKTIPDDVDTRNRLVDVMLEHVCENLDPYYGSDEEPTDIPDSIVDAAKVFADTLIKDWPVTQCEEVERETVDVHAWLKEHRPEWLEKENNK